MPDTLPAMPRLTGKQARFLRGLGHKLRPVVMIGRQEISETVLASVDEALTAHELIKVKLQEGCLLDRHAVAEQLAAASGAAVAQILGKTILLYRPSEQRLIDLP
ncbi:MAG: ribosome assembly RNA-binding protein YhbY [Desulfuromonadales bacterium]|nr:ribosome assembly RNA-binding protein YhbY [Desulfuromonadales bacterium]